MLFQRLLYLIVSRIAALVEARLEMIEKPKFNTRQTLYKHNTLFLIFRFSLLICSQFRFISDNIVKVGNKNYEIGSFISRFPQFLIYKPKTFLI